MTIPGRGGAGGPSVTVAVRGGAGRGRGGVSGAGGARGAPTATARAFAFTRTVLRALLFAFASSIGPAEITKRRVLGGGSSPIASMSGSRPLSFSR